ncbi:DEAD/DEAH box helicase [Bacillus wiedmannii]|uniref:DEAD/DEAH box helicase n=1 Tax=Bacillus wiedmannii TaxID=1890302 RepID=UPI000BF1B96E|nr:DEAD/DEAH box helicase [Bacillus wiedmannii]PEI74635.1 helicase [Bacillus wiedmannii]
MYKNAKSILQQHVENIKTTSMKACLIVFKGFDMKFLEEVHIEKLLAQNYNYSLSILNDNKAMILPEVFTKVPHVKKEDCYWCTFEEYTCIGKDMISIYFDIKIIKNNIYNNIFPSLYTIAEIESLYADFYDNDEYIDDENMPPSLQLFSEYYGNLLKINNSFYITYIDEDTNLLFYPEKPIPIESEETIVNDFDLEISEDETAFLNFTSQILESLLKKTYYLSFSGDIDSLVNRYKERISVLNNLLDLEIKIISKHTKQITNYDESDYIRILEKYWNYSSFRPLKMYKNINDKINQKEIIEISQSQIIHDLVREAENAKKGDNYKDIFVTSPTGAGKSVMFQIPAIHLAEKYGLMTIVISPLIGLMKDQVENMENKAIDISATINSEITPIEKMEIIENIKEGKISILYISPETLLSRSDIKLLIGERQIGLFIIDEAHIVTTWGKAFRSDYWYLGSYLSKLRKENNGFPIATFTATAIYGGVEDMYAETRDGLNLTNPITYFGYIKRDDIQVKLKKVKKEQNTYNEYLSDKFTVMLTRIQKRYLPRGEKTLIYFPMVKLIHNFLDFVQIKDPDLYEKITIYYGPMTKETKSENFQKFRSGEAKIMLATKAFGMGIDIPDILNVYHFAPTGNVCDYVQEIGRAARDLPVGYAYFDFFKSDFTHVNRLHGISTIKKLQLIQVMEKILNLVNTSRSKHSRNLLVSAEEFRYIFSKKTSGDYDDDIDNKLKTALLIIEKDFIAKMDYSPIVARPRNIFAKEYFIIKKDEEQDIVRQYSRYFKLEIKRDAQNSQIYENVYVCDLKTLWEDRFKSMSFPQFKYYFHQKNEQLKLPFLHALIPVLQIEMDFNKPNEQLFIAEFKNIIMHFNNIFSTFARNNKYFTVQDISHELQQKTHQNKYYCENLTQIFLQSAENYDRLQKKNLNFYTKFLKFYEDRDAYTIKSGYTSFTDKLLVELNDLLNSRNAIKASPNNIQIFLHKGDQAKIERTFILLGIIEATGLLVYRVNGGNSPEIYIRINSKRQLEQIVQTPNRYNNFILNNVTNRHKISVAMLMYLFNNEVSSEQFWNYIEDYFLGNIPYEVMSVLPNHK